MDRRHSHEPASPPEPALDAVAGYRTLAAPGEAEVVVKRSRFLGRARPVANEQAAQIYLAVLRKQHWEASHACFAYVLGSRDEVQRSSDAGEPAGTAGRPILETIKKEELKNTIVVVIRYFGGVLLGAGGLTRAYGQAATAAIRAAGVARMLPHRHYLLTVPYCWHDTVVHDLGEQGLRVAGSAYAGDVALEVLIPLAREAEVVARLRNLTNGQIALTAGDVVEVGVSA